MTSKRGLRIMGITRDVRYLRYIGPQTNEQPLATVERSIYGWSASFVLNPSQMTPDTSERA